MTGLNEIKTKLSANKNELSQKYHVKEIGIFGSYAREAQREDSDIDILVAFEKIPGLLKFLELENHLTDLLGVEVDLVRKEAIREDWYFGVDYQLVWNVITEEIPQLKNELKAAFSKLLGKD